MTRFRKFPSGMDAPRWNEYQHRRYIYAMCFLMTAISLLTLVYISRDESPIKDWIREIETFLRAFREEIGIYRIGEPGCVRIKNRIAKNFDEIYNNSMIDVLEEVCYAVEDGEEWRFFDEEISEDIRDKIMKILHKIRTNTALVTFIPDDIIEEFKAYHGIPQKPPWTLKDVLSVKLPEDFGTYKYEVRNGVLIIEMKDQHIASLKEILLSKFPDRN